MKKSKRIISLLLAMALLCGGFSEFVDAEEVSVETTNNEVVASVNQSSEIDITKIENLEVADIENKNELPKAETENENKIVEEPTKTETVIEEEKSKEPITEVPEENQYPVAMFSTVPDEGIPINKETFPDDAFRKIIQDKAYGMDGKLTLNEILCVESLNIDDVGVKSFKGIEYFTELKNFVAKTVNLKTLDLSGNLKINDIRLTNCSSLENFKIGNNLKLEQLVISNSEQNEATKGILDTSGCLNLKKIQITKTNIDTVDFSKNTKLESIDCPDNQFKKLDLSKNVALIDLICNGNLFESLDFSNCPNLKTVMAMGCTKLTSVNFGDINKVTSLIVTRSPISKLDITKLIDLEKLWISNTNIQYIDNTNNAKLTEFVNSPNPYVMPLDKSKKLDLRDFVPQEVLDKITGICINGVSAAYNKNPIIENIDPTKKMFIQAKLPGKIKGNAVAISTYITPQGVNEWITPLSIQSWGVQDTANTPTAQSAFGDDTIEYVYSDAIDGTYTSDVPSTAGIYYVKATVAKKTTYSYGMYSELESEPVRFTINDWTSSLSVEGWKYGDTPSTPQISAVAGSDKIVFEYAKEKNGAYIEEVPTELGTWYVRAVIKPTNEYVGLTSESVSFAITKNSNRWVHTPTMKDWTLGSTANKPNAEARFGNEDIRYQYSNQENGVYSNDVPTDPGIWYVKATVLGNEKYGGLEAITKFEIILPEIIGGLSVTYTTGSANNAIFTCSGLLEDLTNVYVDGKLLSSEHYKLKSGSTILTLDHEYLDTLVPGKHMLKFEYGRETAEIVFEVVKGKDIDKDDSKDITPDKGNSKDKDTIPDTGDYKNSISWIYLLIIAGSVFVLGLICKRINFNKE